MATPATAAAAAALRGGGQSVAIGLVGGGQQGDSGGGKARWVLGGAVVLLFVLVAVFVSIFAVQQQQACTPGSAPGADDPADLTTLEIAARIYAVGRQMDVNERIMISGFITGLVESGGGVQMRNLPCENPGDCDADSVGVFQQRNMAPWNTRNRRNVSEAARTYFEVALTKDAPGLAPSEISIRTQAPAEWTYSRNRDPAVYNRAVRILERIKSAELDGGTIVGGSTGVVGGGADGAERMIWPTSIKTVSSPYGNRVHPIHGGVRLHAGIDISAPTGTPVFAVLTGRIVYRGWMDGYGNYVCVAHHTRLTTCYAHLSRFGRGAVNQTVAQGTVIGYVGSTGGSTGPHLHFETREGNTVGAAAVDPQGYLGHAADAPAGADEDDLGGGLPCAADTLQAAGEADLSQAVKVTEPRRMEYLPSWATAEGYTSPAIVNGRARVDARIIPNVLWMLRRYNVRVHDCLASGHNTHGSGASCDIVPADDPLPRPGRMTPGWKNVERLARDLGWEAPGPGYPGGYACNSGAPFVPAIAIVCYNGDVNHGDPAHVTGSCACPHLHVTWQNPVHSAPVALDIPPEWVMTFPVSPVSGGAGGSDVAMVGDSLAVGTEPFLARKLDDLQVRTNARESRPLAEGLDVIRGLPNPPDVLAVSLFTNDDPRHVEQLAAGVRTSLQHVAPGGCVVWSTIARPPVRGVSYERANDRLRALAAELPGVVVVDWAGFVRQRPNLLQPDGVHATSAGYKARAELYAAGIRRCAS